MSEKPLEGLSLAMLSPKDKPWQVHKALNCTVSQLLHETKYETQSQRMSHCGCFLAFQQRQHIHTGELKLKLKSLHTCKVRICSICSWAKSRVWKTRLNDGLPKLFQAHPTARAILLTLTVKTCPVTALRQTLDMMQKGFARFMDSRSLKKYVLGYIRTMEVTRVFDWYDARGKFLGRHGMTWFIRHKLETKTTWKAKPTNECHPHYHVLLVVKPSYFSHGYKSQQEYIDLWEKSAKLNYKPIVDIRTIKPNPKSSDDKFGIISAIKEVAKYCVKHSDVIYDQAYLVELITQLNATKHVVLGGLLKAIVNCKEPTEDDIMKASRELEDDNEWLDLDIIFFYWHDCKKDYLTYTR